MITLTFRLKKMLLPALAIVLVLCLGAFGINALTNRDLQVNQGAAKSEKIKVPKISGKTNEDRLTFIESFGWVVETEPAEVIEVIVPKEFDQVYTDYNNMQNQQGFDLTKYAGKRCKRYAYIITNYPGTEEPVRVSLLINGNRIIGGDVCSMEQDSFMHGFAMPE